MGKEDIDNLELEETQDREQFVKDFITTYKSCPMLWDSSHKDYRNRDVRKGAYEKIVEKCREYHPDITDEYVKTRIDSIRSSFRRECVKLKSKEGYKPSLWYFNMLSFLGKNKDESKKIELAPTRSVNHQLSFWTREYSAILIEIFKKHKCTYLPKYSTSRYRTMRQQALEKVTKELMSVTKKKFRVFDVRRRIQMLKGQFRGEYCKVKASEASGEEPPYKSSLWCYNQLLFLGSTIVKSQKLTEHGQRESCSDSEMPLKMENEDNFEDNDDNDLDICNPNDVNSNERSVDIYDTIAKNVAHKMRDMTEEQNKIAQRVLNDLMYYGLMEELTPKARLSLDGR